VGVGGWEVVPLIVCWSTSS